MKLVKLDWKRLEEIHKEIEDIINHHSLLTTDVLTELENLINEVKTIEEG